MLNLLLLAARNVTRNKFRTTLTVLGTAIAILAYILLRTVVWAWTAGTEMAPTDRVVTRHKVTFIMPLPKRYIEETRQIPGVETATWANWFGGKDPRHEHEFFGTIAIEDHEFWKVYPDVVVAPAEREKWMQDRRGAIVGDQLAKKLGWKVGDRVVLEGTIVPGNFEFNIDGTYTTQTKSLDRSTFYFHWDYMNDVLPERGKEMIGWVISRVQPGKNAADVAVAIDKHFDDHDTQTLSQDERAFQASFLGMFSAVLTALNIVSKVILAIMMLILGNTIAMGVRERTHEYGTLRAIGFMPRHVAVFVLGEALATGILGGVLGVGVAYPLINQGMGRWIEENMGNFFPFFSVQPGLAAKAFALAVGLALVAALVPAYRAFKVNVVTALRRVG